VSHTDGQAAHRNVRSGLVLHAGAITAAAFDPPSARLATAGRDGLVKLWAVPAGEARVAGGAENDRVSAPSARRRPDGSSNPRRPRY
jgi:hypothetical protein